MSTDETPFAEKENITQLLLQWSVEKKETENHLLEAVYGELNKIASYQLRNSRRSTEFEPSTLVHEAYLKLINIKKIDWQDRVHFFAIAAKIMREVLVDHARQKASLKRDGGIQLTLSYLPDTQQEQKTNALVLHKALEELAIIDPQKARLVELKYFGGMTNEETALALSISTATVKRYWDIARGWLLVYMSEK